MFCNIDPPGGQWVEKLIVDLLESRKSLDTPFHKDLRLPPQFGTGGPANALWDIGEGSMDCATRRTHGVLCNPRILGIFLVACWVASPLSTVWAQAEVYLYADLDGDGVKEETTLTATTPVLQGKIPVLFVHGHDLEHPNDEEFNFRKNWQQAPSGLTSFKEALDLPENAWLDIEPYYIRFQGQNRSIVEDARDIAWAVEHILHRHDPAHNPDPANNPNPSTNVRVAIIGFSKGTISSRLYLKSLHEQQYDLPPPRDGFNPVSEFVAIAPPNHGLALNLVALGALLQEPSILSSLALMQLNNGYRHNCAQYVLHRTESQQFIGTLNGHVITDTMPPPSAGSGWSPGTYDTEAPGSRSNGSSTSAGTLYVALYADSDENNVGRDLVGGGFPSTDCQGRILAKNLASDAENIEVSAIPGLNPTDVHTNTVHTPEVICLALYTVARHQVPNNPTTFACETVGQTPIIPQPPLPWWWWILVTLFLVAIIPFVYLLRRGFARRGP